MEYVIIPPNTLEVSATKALTYIEHGKTTMIEKPKPEIMDFRDTIVRVTLGSICIATCISSVERSKRHG